LQKLQAFLLVVPADDAENHWRRPGDGHLHDLPSMPAVVAMVRPMASSQDPNQAKVKVPSHHENPRDCGPVPP
jgi:hypothetical protein